MASISLKYKSKQGNLTAPGDVDPGAMIPIATVTASGSATYIDFTSIPSNYEHLQIRAIARSTVAATEVGLLSSINGDNGSNYSWHHIYGNGASASASAGSTYTYMNYGANIAGANATANNYGIFIIDILDYSNTSKYKTFRGLGGTDNNGSGWVQLGSGLWQSTSVVNQIRLATGGGNFTSSSSFALYGIKKAGA